MDNPEKLATQVRQDKAKTKGKKPNTICVGHHYPQALNKAVKFPSILINTL
jgi:hypothetical protein